MEYFWSNYASLCNKWPICFPFIPSGSGNWLIYVHHGLFTLRSADYIMYLLFWRWAVCLRLNKLPVLFCSDFQFWTRLLDIVCNRSSTISSVLIALTYSTQWESVSECIDSVLKLFNTTTIILKLINTIWAPAWYNQQFCFFTRSDTNQAVQLLEIARGLKFWI